MNELVETSRTSPAPPLTASVVEKIDPKIVEPEGFIVLLYKHGEGWCAEWRIFRDTEHAKRWCLKAETHVRILAIATVCKDCLHTGDHAGEGMIVQTPDEIADEICEKVQAEYGQEVWITGGHNAGMDFRELIAAAIARERQKGNANE